jgi:hypothetical protein
MQKLPPPSYTLQNRSVIGAYEGIFCLVDDANNFSLALVGDCPASALGRCVVHETDLQVLAALPGTHDKEHPRAHSIWVLQHNDAASTLCSLHGSSYC